MYNSNGCVTYSVFLGGLMRKISTAVFALCALLCIGVMLTACGGADDGHSYLPEWSKDDNYHWHACADDGCTEMSDKASHTWNEGEIIKQPTADSDGERTYTCTVCQKTKVEPVKYVADQDQTVHTESLVFVHPHRGNLAITVYDSKGRLTDILHASDTLDWKYPYVSSLYTFAYGDDGRLSYYGSASFKSAVAYSDDGSAYFTETSSNSRAISLESLSYHDNGSIKEISYYYGTQLQTDTYDEYGRATSVAWSNENGTGGAYLSENGGNKETVTMLQNGELYDADIVIEFNSDGNPIRQTTRMGAESVVDKEWTYDGKRLVTLSDYSSSSVCTLTYDSNGYLIGSETLRNGQTAEYTVYTNSADGSRLTEKYYGANDNYKEGYTYEYSDGALSTYTHEVIEEGRRSVRVRTARNEPVSNTDYFEYENEFNGKMTVYYIESYTKYFSDGRISLTLETTYVDIDGVKTKYKVETRRSNYDVPDGANYDFVRMDSLIYCIDYDVPSNHIDLNTVYYVRNVTEGNTTYEKWVDESTGTPLPEGDNKCRDNYGNYYAVVDGVATSEIIYYQKYCDNSGNYYYFTNDGVKTPLN